MDEILFDVKLCRLFVVFDRLIIMCVEYFIGWFIFNKGGLYLFVCFIKRGFYN